VEATLRAHQEEWLSLEIRVCPPTLLGQVRQALPRLPAAAPWLCRLQAAIAEDPIESSRGLLGYFSSTQMELIDSLFVSMREPDPWGCVINPLWATQPADVAEAWDQAAVTSAVPPSRKFPTLLPREHSREHSPCPYDGGPFARGTRTWIIPT